MSAQPWVLWMCDRLIREVPMDIGPLRNVIEIRTSIAELIAAGQRTTSAFRALGRDKSLIPNPAQVRECEASMLALDAALAAVTKEPSHG